MSSFELGQADRLFQNVLERGDKDSRYAFLRLLEKQFNGRNGTSGGSAVAVERYGGVLTSPVQASERIMRSVTPLPTGQAATTVLSTPGGDPWAATTDVWIPANQDEHVAEGNIVQISRGPMAQLCQPRATYPWDRRVAVGVVMERLGGWVRVRLAGRAMVQMETDDWREPLSDEVWVSENSDGIGTEIMPYSARNGIVLIGYRIGPLKNNLAEVLVVPAILPAVWHRAWEYDEWNYIDVEYIAVRSGYWRMVFVVGGTCQAILDEQYGFRMRGQVTSNPYTSDTQDSAVNSRLGQIEYDASSSMNSALGAICFQVPHQTAPNTYTRVAELNANGDMLVGSRSTGVAPIPAASSADFSGAWYGTTGGNVDLTFDGVQAWMRFERTSTGTDPVNADWQVERYTEDVLP